MSSNACDVHDDEGTVEHIELAFLDVEHRKPILYGYRAKRWK